VVVTGASGGVGRAVARSFGTDEARVALLARGRAGLDAVAEEVSSTGGVALPLQVDVADAEAVEAAADRVEAELGPIDVWVNVAFAGVLAPFTAMDAADYRRVTEVTYLGTVHGTMAALRRMRTRDHGVVVQVGSALAYRGIPLQSAYCGAKHAIQGFNESVRCELLHAGSHVRTTMVQLPAVNTPQFDWCRTRDVGRPRPVAPVYQPEVVARTIRYAASHPRRREYWVGGSTVGTLLANRIAPGLLDRYLGLTGVAAQQEGPLPAERDGNLWQPVDDDTDHGARGRFDDESLERSPQAWLARHRWLSGIVAGAVAVSGAVALRAATRRS